MKWRYNVRTINFESEVPWHGCLASIPVLSKKARQGSNWFHCYRPIIKTIAPPVAIFSISPQTFYRWKWRYDPDHLESLENSSCRPEKISQPTCSTELVIAAQKVREEYCGWGKDKLAVLLYWQGFSFLFPQSGALSVAFRHAVSSTSWPGIIFQLIGGEFNDLRHEQAKGLLG